MKAPMDPLHKTIAIQASGKKLPWSIHIRFGVPKLNDILRKFCRHCAVYQAHKSTHDKAPRDSHYFPIPEHGSVSSISSMLPVSVNRMGAKGSTATPFDALLVCVDMATKDQLDNEPRSVCGPPRQRSFSVK